MHALVAADVNNESAQPRRQLRPGNQCGITVAVRQPVWHHACMHAPLEEKTDSGRTSLMQGREQGDERGSSRLPPMSTNALFTRRCRSITCSRCGSASTSTLSKLHSRACRYHPAVLWTVRCTRREVTRAAAARANRIP